MLDPIQYDSIKCGHGSVLSALQGAIFPGETAWQAPSFETLLANPTCFGFFAIPQKNREAPFGFLLMQTVLDEAEILSFGILPKFRKKGVGSALLQHGLYFLQKQNITEVFLEVAEDNLAALKTYQALNFKQYGKRQNYYNRQKGVTCSALLLKKLLS